MAIKKLDVGVGYFIFGLFGRRRSNSFRCQCFIDGISVGLISLVRSWLCKLETQTIEITLHKKFEFVCFFVVFLLCVCVGGGNVKVL